MLTASAPELPFTECRCEYLHRVSGTHIRRPGWRASARAALARTAVALDNVTQGRGVPPQARLSPRGPAAPEPQRPPAHPPARAADSRARAVTSPRRARRKPRLSPPPARGCPGRRSGHRWLASYGRCCCGAAACRRRRWRLPAEEGDRTRRVGGERGRGRAEPPGPLQPLFRVGRAVAALPHAAREVL